MSRKLDTVPIAISRRCRSVLAAGLMVASAMSAAAAQTGQAGVADLRGACQADYQRLCGNVSPGGGRVRQCMLDNADRLSPPCKDALKARAANGGTR